MDKEDAKLCFQRHATSKITSDEDLFKISAYGFRGEAMPSIASVSRMELDTATKNAPEGTRVIIEGGTLKNITASAPTSGTIVKVNDLFFNTPARKKFQKSIPTEFNKIMEVIYNLAIVNHNISFELIHDNKTILKSPARENKLLKIADIYGDSLSKEMYEFNYKDEFINIYGYISRPALTRSNRTMQKIFVNNRAVKDISISFSINNSYKNILPHQRHAIVFLFIDVPPAFIDVNVHPSKDEVKFQDESFVNGMVSRTLKKAVEEMLIKPALENIEDDQIEKIKEIKTQSPVAQSILKFYEHSANSTSYTPIRQNILNKDRDIIYSVSTEQKIVKEELPNQLRMDIRWDKMQIFQDLYVILPVGNELWIIDQHAAHERILYEKFKNNVNEQKKISQELLFPITIDINKQQANLLTELIPYLENLGIIIEDFGNDSIIIRSIPVLLKKVRAEHIHQQREVLKKNITSWIMKTYKRKSRI